MAKELSLALSAGKLDGMAAVDPSTPGAFVAAIYIPGAQLLVVSAKYAVPSLLLDKINTRATTAASTWTCIPRGSPGSRVFVQDQGRWPSSGAPKRTFQPGVRLLGRQRQGDSVRRRAWKKAKMSEADYTKAFVAADERYAKLLSLLLAQANKKEAVDTGRLNYSVP